MSEHSQNVSFPFKELKPGFYGYSRPGWVVRTRVEIYLSTDFHAGELLVRFVKNFYGMRLSDLPMDATFAPIADNDFPMR